MLQNLLKESVKTNKSVKETEKENNDMRRINGNELKQVVINEKEKIVTVISKVKNRCITFENNEDKVVTMSKCHENDEFDKYIGTALAIAYQLFGSKTQFHKYVDNEAKNLNEIKEKKAESKSKKKQNK